MKKVITTALILMATGVIILVLMGVSLGATGFSDKVIGSQINEELRELRQSLAQTIRDPDKLEEAVALYREELREQYGLNDHWVSRVGSNTMKVLLLDLGEAKTMRTTEGSNSIRDIVIERLPRTLLLMLPSLFIVALIGVTVGVLLATRAGGKLDRTVSVFSAISLSLPAWWFGIILILLLGVYWNVLPTSGMFSAPPPEGGIARFLDMLKHAILPITSLVAVSIGPYLYVIRSITLRVAHENFVTYAHARGLSEWRVRYRILRVSAPTILTGLILGLAGSVGGAILTETVFNWPGMGRLYYEAIIGTPDEGLIVALTFLFTAIYLTARFVLEILYVVLDPRVHLGG